MGRAGSTTTARAGQMRRVLGRWQQSGLSLREFGQQRGIPLSTLTWWRQVFRRAGEPVNGTPAAKAVVFTEVPRPATVLTRPAALEIALRSGHVLRVPAGVDTETLHRVLQALQKSPLGTAIGYALRNWIALARYTEDGRLKIDNNGAEQALRPIVLGRKNWLFAGSEAAAHRTAILCSLVQTCKHLQIDPFVYLRDVIERGSTHPARLILELTPRDWKRRRQDRAVQAAA
ncbi:MAG: Transposase [Deltaproteobacteria bacterium]|nr:Transposase [Deltaproteobacteria bacterium]